MKFIHAADLHIDSPMRRLDTYDGAPVDLLRSNSQGACRLGRHISLGAMRVRLQAQAQLGFERGQLAVRSASTVLGLGARFLQPLLDGVARQTGAPLNLADG